MILGLDLGTFYEVPSLNAERGIIEESAKPNYGNVRKNSRIV